MIVWNNETTLSKKKTQQEILSDTTSKLISLNLSVASIVYAVMPL